MAKKVKVKVFDVDKVPEDPKERIYEESNSLSENKDNFFDHVVDKAKSKVEKGINHVEKISGFGKDTVEYVLYGANDIYNRTKHDKNKGREIVVNKKDSWNTRYFNYFRY